MPVLHEILCCPGRCFIPDQQGNAETGSAFYAGNQGEFGLGITLRGCIMPGMKGSRILVLTGPGKGKTTSAFGMALRALGHGGKVAVIQFIKHDGSPAVSECGGGVFRGRIYGPRQG